jgi:TusA-related sulfurtransferase
MKKGQRPLPLFHWVDARTAQFQILDSLAIQPSFFFSRIDMMNDHQRLPDMPVTELDLRGVICPYNFVKTKLKLETLKQGQVLSVLLDDGDPIRNVPRSVENEGHTVISQERVDQAYRVLIRREESD